MFLDIKFLICLKVIVVFVLIGFVNNIFMFVSWFLVRSVFEGDWRVVVVLFWLLSFKILVGKELVRRSFLSRVVCFFIVC